MSPSPYRFQSNEEHPVVKKIPELHGLLKFNHFYPEVAVQSDRLGEGSPEGSVVVRTNDKRVKNLSGSHEQS